MASALSVVVLAAGQGTRMRSRVPKVLHTLADRPLLAHVLDTAAALQPAAIYVVHGHGAEAVRAHFATRDDVHWVLQAEQHGTGHAVAQALPAIPREHRVLVLYGDVPLVEVDTLRRLLAAEGALALMTATLKDPTGYGRIQRDADGRVHGIVEQKDAGPEQLAIREVNTGILAADAARLGDWLARVDNSNAQGEYYLTDVVGLAATEGVEVASAQPDSIDEILGVNDRSQLAHLERVYQRRAAERLMRAGVTLRDPARFDLRGTLEAGQDVTIDVNVIIEGRVVLGSGVSVGAHCVLKDVTIADGAQIAAHSVLDGAEVGAGARIGPFARLRPGARLAAAVHVGNFVEVKASEVGEGSKINHLSYVGDAHVGAGVNIGAGTITCNYDGANKHRTVIGDGAFIGSDTQLVAPVTVGPGATIGAGSTITRDTPADELTLSRSPQRTVKGWQRPVKAPKPSEER
ncbi:bifunctional UDP-N-acetylglucosamine diphosphorylase/glucosamine-1-phosphate N-acetyltransferase GlmU [Ectothiorhodospiraceae bacterium 2226]|nr:bifunctional UDP-N-acetylglucosamine diphosphorylase/glucosamine-1-phosphate N-acetyltransferase GlmU [Ectothiorhodospiraceae bacterium 2226]